MNWKGFERKQSWLNFEVVSRYSPVYTEENQESLSQDSRSPSRDLNPEPREYAAGVLTTNPRRSVLILQH
jgi:hypothetical protein